MTIDRVTYTKLATYIDDNHITPDTIMALLHMESVPHANVITLLASNQIRWTHNIMAKIIPTWVLDSLKKILLNQIPTIKRFNVNKLASEKDPTGSTITSYKVKRHSLPRTSSEPAPL
jgi:hypothetical protein